MKDFRRIFILGATLLITVTGAALAEQTEPSSPARQTTSFWSWLFPSSAPAVAPKPRSAPTGRLASAPEAAKPRQNCSLLTCVTLVGIGF
jgi:hypothetical protein